MKKIILLGIAILSMHTTHSQIVLDVNDFGVPGQVVRMGRDTLLQGISVGSIGMQTWDFSSFVFVNYGQNQFVNPSVFPSASNFPAANVVYQTTNLKTFINANSNKVEALGFDGDVGTLLGGSSIGVNVTIPFTNPQTLMPLPAQYNDVFIDTATFNKSVSSAEVNPTFSGFVDSIRITHFAVATHKIDAYGTLILLNDTQEVLRKEKVEYFIDTVWAKTTTGIWFMPDSFPGYFSENPIRDTLITYEWYAKGKKFPMVTLNMNTDGSILDALFIADSMLVAGAGSVGALLCNGDANGVVGAQVVAYGTPPYTYAWSNGSTGSSSTNLSAGNYFVTITDSEGKKGRAFARIVEPAALEISADVYHTSCNTCSDGEIQVFPQGGTAPYTYQWDLGSTDQEYENLGIGSYRITVIDNNGCTNNTEFQVGVEPVGLDELENQDPFIVTPNPARESIRVSAGPVQIFNVLGRKVLEDREPKSHYIDVSGFEKGIYFIVNPSQNHKTLRLVIQ